MKTGRDLVRTREAGSSDQVDLYFSLISQFKQIPLKISICSCASKDFLLTIDAVLLSVSSLFLQESYIVVCDISIKKDP